MGTPDVFDRLGNTETCRANPDITVDEARAAQHPKNPQQVTIYLDDQGNPKPAIDPSTVTPLPPGYTLEQPARKSVRPKTIEGTVTKDAVVYSETLPGGPGGQVLAKVESGTHVRVLRLDPIYGNVQVRTPSGITGWLSSGEINY